MKFKIFEKKYSSLSNGVSVCKIAVPALGVSLVIAMFGWLSKDVVVTVAPPEYHKAFKISRDQASSAYRESWALSLAILVGNASPKQANYIIDQVRAMLTPGAYKEVNDSLVEHFANLSKNGLVTTFTPREITSVSDGRVYVTGELKLKGKAGKPKVMTYTFVVNVRIQNYLPSITKLDFFEGVPKKRN